MRRLTAAELTSPDAWAQLLGARVTLRYRLHGDAGHPFSEAAGVVRAVAHGEEGPDCVEIVTRRGDVRRVPLGDVVAAKAL
ncbi:MAG TPA: hypothetical protein VHJ34_09985 [Actinomycetota bacterium]|nr:hypothetical protein [Actinomycetota bacterium]